MPDLTETAEVSFGWVFDRLTRAKVKLNDANRQTTEHYERQIGEATLEAVEALEDVVIVLRDHLSCHDCDEEGSSDEIEDEVPGNGNEGRHVKSKKRKGKKGKK